jgi:hypothetical protein
MMSTKNIILTLIIALFSLTMFSQVPGFMGRRLTLGYSNNFFLAGVGPTASSYDVGINTTHSFNAEYTIKNRTNLCASFQMFKTGVITNRTFYEDVYSSSSGSYNYMSYRYNPSPDLPMVLNAKCVALGFKFFSSGALAPVGKYKKLELVIMFCNLSYDRDGFTDNDATGSSYNSLGTGNYSFKSFALTYTIGRQRIIGSRIVLDYGMQFGFLPNVVPAYILSDGESVNISAYNGPALERAFRQDSNIRLFRYELFNFHIGIGLLAL